MAKIYPSFEKISKLKVNPTEGELFLLDYLSTNLSDDYEVYFQPYLNGDMPDIIIMKKGGGVLIIEVKDWNLSSYDVDSKNKWREKKSGSHIRSPYAQAFGYKSNMFNLHINGLAEKNALNKNFFNTLKTIVYFHNSKKTDIDSLFQEAENENKGEIIDLNNKFREKEIPHEQYEKKRDHIDRKKKQLTRDKSLSITTDRMQEIKKHLPQKHILFSDDIYTEFLRYLQPPYHVAKQGRHISYDKKQSRLVLSQPGFQKIKGVAGCGKTTILAKRAVNSHKRHQDKVLILTYNKTLRNYIRDKISEVREDFSWSAFCITNYHSFITQTINSCGINIDPPKDYAQVSAYFDKFYSDVFLFSDYESSIEKYKTIVIDEIQDYKPEWIEIIKKYFLASDGEMVLFGDDSQNIYGREINSYQEKIKGFGRWEILTKSYRSKNDSPLTLLANKYQERFLLNKYGNDLVEVNPEQSSMNFDIIEGNIFQSDLSVDLIFHSIRSYIKKNNIHPNDICILSSNISKLRELDFRIRTEMNEKTQTTFESKEQFDRLQEQYKDRSECLKHLEAIRGSKKFSFNLNSGLVKLSTIHSFKGLEASTTFYILSEEDNDELVYTGITRANHNLINYIPSSCSYGEFFRQEITTHNIS